MTRVLALAGRRPSGVDRVCLAYLRAVLSDGVPCFGLVRTGLGFVLLDQAGMEACLEAIEGQRAWPAPDFISRMRHRVGSARRVPDTMARQAAMARARPRGLGRMLQRYVPEGCVYINADQTTFTTRVAQAVKSVKNGKITVFIHDTIPLDHPQYQTPRSVEKLAAILKRCASYADLILTNSHVSASDIARHMAPLGEVPPVEVAHLGVEVDFFATENNQSGASVAAPYFLCLGTIEPRKNICFLLDLWEDMARRMPEDEVPRLVIAGRRGWESADVLTRLESSPLRGKILLEFNDLGDKELRSLIGGTDGLLFPSHAEGFGLPPVEAAAMGVPVVANVLPVLREILGDYPIYASVSDVYLWETIIRTLATAAKAGSETHQRFTPPTWEAHFNSVLRVT
ncbi:MAG: glycosyltransferase family 4 protein [Shimia sp.]|nr:glycosyltransferase family 4 protein [Shimia sp.]